MGTQSHRSHFHVLLALWIGMALVIAPLTVQAAPMGQTSYVDPDERFSMTVPESFTTQVDITYEMMGDNPLDKLVASSGVAFSEVESPNGVQALFLLLDESISDRDEFAGFLAAFQIAAGGELLPLVDLEFADDQSLIAVGVASNDERNLRIQLEAEDNVAAVITSSVEKARVRGLRGGIDEAFASFDWDPEAVRTFLGGEPEPTPPEPIADDTGDDVDVTTEETSGAALSKKEPTENTAPINDPQFERYYDEEEVYSIEMPSGMTVEDASDESDAIYGFTYWADEDSPDPSLIVGFSPAAYAGDLRTDEFEMWEIEDDEWDAVVETFVIDDLSDMNVYTDIRNSQHRTAFLVFEAEEDDLNNPPEVWVWMEESDGVVAVVAIFGELNDPVNSELFHQALTTFEWSPADAMSTLSYLVDVFNPSYLPNAFDDPFGLVELYTPDDFPFEAAFFSLDGLEYQFGQDSLFGASYFDIYDLDDEALSAADWEFFVADQEETLLSVLQDEASDGIATLLSSEIDILDVDADNTAVIHAEAEDYHFIEVLVDSDGVVASHIYFLDTFYWELFVDDIEIAIDQGIVFDPEAVRDLFAAQQELGITTQYVETVGPSAEDSDFDELVYDFYPDESVKLVVKFDQTDIEENVEVIVHDDVLPGYPLAQFGLWVGAEEEYSTNKSTFQDESGTEATFTYVPDAPMNAGDYVANVYYDEELVAASGFTVWDDDASETDLVNFSITYSDFENGEPPLATTAINQSDVVVARGTGNLPAESQLRLFWYNEDGQLINDDVATIRSENSYRAPYNWFIFEPIIDWQPGFYHYTLTLDGEVLDEGKVLVVGDEDEVALTTDAGEYMSYLPLSTDVEVVPAAEGGDIALKPDDIEQAKDIVSGLDAWLRMQGWQPTVPQLGSPIYWDYRRWVKDGYQFILQPGDGDSNDELWLNYAPISDLSFGTIPSADALDAINVDNVYEVAKLKLEGLAATEAVVSPDGNWLAVVTSDGALFIFDATRLLDIIFYRPQVYYSNPVFSPDSKNLAVMLQLQSRSEIQVFSNLGVTWLPTTRLNGHTGSIGDIVFQPDGWLASGDADAGVVFWEVTASDNPIMTWTDKPVTGLAAAPDEEPGILIAMEGGYVDYKHDLDGWTWTDMEVSGESPSIAVWSQLDDEGLGDFVVYGEGPAEWYIYDTGAPEYYAQAPELNDTYVATGADFTSNGELLIVGGETTLVYDRYSGDLLHEWDLSDEGNVLRVESLTVSPDGRYVVVVSDDGKVRLWAVAAE